MQVHITQCVADGSGTCFIYRHEQRLGMPLDLDDAFDYLTLFDYQTLFTFARKRKFRRKRQA